MLPSEGEEQKLWADDRAQLQALLRAVSANTSEPGVLPWRQLPSSVVERAPGIGAASVSVWAAVQCSGKGTGLAQW